MASYKEAAYSVELEYSDLQEGETLAGQSCPSCEGGPSGARTFSVTKRDGVLLYLCHRVSCGFRGASQRTSLTREGNRTGRPTPSVYFPPTSPIDEETNRLLSGRFGISEESLEFAGLRWVKEGNGNYSRRVCFPILGPDLRERGASYRSYEGAEPKALVLMRDGQLKAGWYKFTRRCDTLVLVEDPVSAIKLAPHFHSVSLFGTTVAEALVEEFRGKYKRAILALDKDATKQSIKLTLRLRKRVPELRVYALNKDIKDQSDEEFEKCLSDLSDM